MSDADTTIFALRRRIEAFVQARDWEKFHNPKELVTALTIEAAELMELFLWKGAEEADEAIKQGEGRNRVAEELADIMILCLSLANRLEVDVADAVAAKVVSNGAKYPAELVRGKAHKYTHYVSEQ